jgi:hypothetical protein
MAIPSSTTRVRTWSENDADAPLPPLYSTLPKRCKLKLKIAWNPGEALDISGHECSLLIAQLAKSQRHAPRDRAKLLTSMPKGAPVIHLVCGPASSQSLQRVFVMTIDGDFRGPALCLEGTGTQGLESRSTPANVVVLRMCTRFNWIGGKVEAKQSHTCVNNPQTTRARSTSRR